MTTEYEGTSSPVRRKRISDWGGESSSGETLLGKETSEDTRQEAVWNEEPVWEEKKTKPRVRLRRKKLSRQTMGKPEIQSHKRVSSTPGLSKNLRPVHAPSTLTLKTPATNTL